MPGYDAPLSSMDFLLSSVFDFEKAVAALGYSAVDLDLARSVLAEAGRFCAEVLAPLNAVGDREGCRIVDGVVRTPNGFPEAYADYVAGGWPGLAGDVAHGGQGLPRTLQVLVDEMLSASNLSFGLFPGLTRGAAEALSRHGSEPLKALYLPRLVSGEWTGAMALTEASAGSDLGLLTTRATPRPDGSFLVKGTKIFISSGDHDFGGNVVHLVLARLPDAPQGAKGISLFLVPKYRLDANGEPEGELNFLVASLEDKMGIHAQPTCVMNYDDSVGWLVGNPNEGLRAMFTMMNAERLFVGMQGLGLADAAYQMAVAYAKDRRQGRHSGGDAGTARIIEHADVRRMLLTIRAFTEAGRALAVWVALHMDTAADHPDVAMRSRSECFVALLTPVIKSAFTDMGFESTVLAQQVFGGHGYIREWGVEQLVRDARITQIYEGTNGIQALDLVTRKIRLEGGSVVNGLFEIISKQFETSAAHFTPSEMEQLYEALATLKSLTALQQAENSAFDQGAAASDYLRLFALVCLGWMWASIVPANDSKADSLRAVATFFITKILPETRTLAARIQAGGEPLSLSEDEF